MERRSRRPTQSRDVFLLAQGSTEIESMTTEQPILFSSDQLPATCFEEDQGRNPIFTAARLFSTDPNKYQAIIALSAEGIGVLRIASILRVSTHTVIAVRQREPGGVAIEKQRIAGLSREAARMCVEGIIDILADPARVAKVPARDLGILAGILTDKAELLSGGPTMRIEHQRDVSPEDVRDYLSGLEPASVEVMGSGRETEAAKVPAAGAGDPGWQTAGLGEQAAGERGAGHGVEAPGDNGPAVGDPARSTSGGDPGGVQGEQPTDNHKLMDDNDLQNQADGHGKA
jgi:hypothetical protein